MKGFLINTPVLNVAEQMAFDELFAAAAPRDKECFYLRFYNWAAGARAVTFGYAQFWAEIKRELEQKNFGAEAVRRPTGGGVVYHEGDLTFSCVFTSPLRRAQEIYDKLHGAINARLGQSMVPDSAKELYAPSIAGAAGLCFQNPVKSDIVSPQGRKILGGAIRRFDNIILYQGSLQDAGARESEFYRNALTSAIASEWGVTLFPFEAGAEFMKTVRAEAKDRYQSDAWNCKF